MGSPVSRFPSRRPSVAYPADVLYAGEAPGLTRGMQQINVRIPDGAGSGPVAIQINVGGQSTQNGITVFLQ